MLVSSLRVGGMELAVRRVAVLMTDCRKQVPFPRCAGAGVPELLRRERYAPRAPTARRL